MVATSASRRVFPVRRSRGRGCTSSGPLCHSRKVSPPAWRRRAGLVAAGAASGAQTRRCSRQAAPGPARRWVRAVLGVGCNSSSRARARWSPLLTAAMVGPSTLRRLDGRKRHDLPQDEDRALPGGQVLQTRDQRQPERLTLDTARAGSSATDPIHGSGNGSSHETSTGEIRLGGRSGSSGGPPGPTAAAGSAAA